MATFVLVHGAGDAGWYWHLTEAELQARGHQTWPLRAWPDVPTRFILCEDDHFFPAAFMRRVARQRLGIVPDEVPGGHCAALSNPGN